MISNPREEVAEHVPGEDHLDNGELSFFCIIWPLLGQSDMFICSSNEQKKFHNMLKTQLPKVPPRPPPLANAMCAQLPLQPPSRTPPSLSSLQNAPHPLPALPPSTRTSTCPPPPPPPPQPPCPRLSQALPLSLLRFHLLCS